MLLLFLLILAIPVGFIALGFFILKKIIETAVKDAVKQALNEIKQEISDNIV